SENLERNLIARKLDTALFIDPVRDLLKRSHKEVEVELRFVGQGEIEILGEAVCFEIALLEAGSTLENPFVRDRRVVEDAGQQPAEHVVLFDNVRQQPEVGSRSQKLAAVNHVRPPPPN